MSTAARFMALSCCIEKCVRWPGHHELSAPTTPAAHLATQSNVKEESVSGLARCNKAFDNAGNEGILTGPTPYCADHTTFNGGK